MLFRYIFLPQHRITEEWVLSEVKFQPEALPVVIDAAGRLGNISQVLQNWRIPFLHMFLHSGVICHRLQPKATQSWGARLQVVSAFRTCQDSRPALEQRPLSFCVFPLYLQIKRECEREVHEVQRK